MSRLPPADRPAIALAPEATASAILARFLADRAGATAIEYAMIAAGVGVAISTAVWSLGTAVKTTFYDKLSTLF
jgi:pilus assembly protein Flp/PilA